MYIIDITLQHHRSQRAEARGRDGAHEATFPLLTNRISGKLIGSSGSSLQRIQRKTESVVRLFKLPARAGAVNVGMPTRF